MTAEPPINVDRRLQVALGTAAVLLASVLYYGTYLRYGFNYADDGNYAQVCYELFLGRRPDDIAIGYGLLWFKVGEALFRLFGVHYILIRLLFFACITLTNMLIFCTLARMSKRLWVAGLFTAVALIVPAFPATAFYGLCVVMNAAAQLRLASRLDAASPWDAVLAGAALGLSFQIRPDFGFVFTVPLIVLVFLSSHRGAFSRAALAGFVGASLPFFLCAIAGGYAGLLLQQYLDYPALLAGVFLSSLGHSAATGSGMTLLQRPGLEHLGLAALVYVPLLFLAATAALIWATARQRAHERRTRPLAEAIVALTAGVAAFPHYFLFRPDLSHIANFMPGFIVMAGVFLIQLWRSPSIPRRIAVAAGILMALYLGLYLKIGLALPGATGSIAVMAGSSAEFTAANGVHVHVTPDDKLALETARDAIVQNSAPGAAIVCLPYCPGFAFMTARRMLLPNFYADDAFLERKPDWLPSAIALTRTAHPPVVVVADWAINGTERSRFSVWAAPYVEVLNQLARDRIKDGVITIYLLGPAEPAR